MQLCGVCDIDWIMMDSDLVLRSGVLPPAQFWSAFLE